MRKETLTRSLLGIIASMLIAITLVACGSSNGGGGGGNAAGNSNVAGFKTPNPLLFTATPTFPPFTVGVYPSNFSPGVNDTVTFYVWCRIQPADMSGPSQPAPNLTVNVNVASLGKSGSGTTDSEGLATIPITFTNAPAGQPVQVRATVGYNGHGYTAITIFTPGVNIAPSPGVTTTP